MPVAEPNGSSSASLVLGLFSWLNSSRAGRRFIRPYLPEQHRAFYPSLESIFVCVRDEGGMPRAMALTGRAGFIDSPSLTELVISSQQAYDPGEPWPAICTQGSRHPPTPGYCVTFPPSTRDTRPKAVARLDIYLLPPKAPGRTPCAISCMSKNTWHTLFTPVLKCVST